MYVVGVDLPPDGESVPALDALVDHLESDGPVAIVDPGNEVTPASGDELELTQGPTTARVHRDGMEPSSPIGDVLDRLADIGVTYALVTDPPDPSLPRLCLSTPPSGTEEAAILGSLEPDDRPDNARLDELTARIHDLEPHETLASLIRAVEAHPDSPKAGAIATFTGRVRAANIDGERTTHLEYEKYEHVADEEMAAICEELTAREGVYDVAMHHHTGVVEAEADAVYVVVLAGHREEAFAAVSDGIDLLKERVPIFKKEVTESGTFWAHDRP